MLSSSRPARILVESPACPISTPSHDTSSIRPYANNPFPPVLEVENDCEDLDGHPERRQYDPDEGAIDRVRCFRKVKMHNVQHGVLGFPGCSKSLYYENHIA